MEPRFTRDLDFAVAVNTDDEATDYVFRVRRHGYEIVSALEQTARQRLSTIRLRRSGRGPIVDLLFAASGIEVEIVRAADPIEIAAGLVADVAQVGHVIAMKLISRDPERRPRDQQDLVGLATVADDQEWQRAEAASRGSEPISSSSEGSRVDATCAPASPSSAPSPRCEVKVEPRSASARHGRTAPQHAPRERAGIPANFSTTDRVDCCDASFSLVTVNNAMH